jgi:demethylmenaquinone methyltransferase/2-methoxy-6-polyprenyl-1,4-benzoquinol methylase
MKKNENVRRMFDSITPAYDLLNHLFSFGLDYYWRARLVAESGVRPGQRVLDICTGTGDVLRAFHQRIPRLSGLGVDFSPAMLDRARRKCADLPFTFRLGDALHLPCTPQTFNAASMAFGLRNVEDPYKAIKEMRRVLKPGGKILILELTRPTDPFLRLLYWPYLHVFVPLAGRLISRDAKAYSYLRDTIEGFMAPSEVQELMRRAGFTRVRADALTFGLVTLFIASE